MESLTTASFMTLYDRLTPGKQYELINKLLDTPIGRKILTDIKHTQDVASLLSNFNGRARQLLEKSPRAIDYFLRVKYKSELEELNYTLNNMFSNVGDLRITNVLLNDDKTIPVLINNYTTKSLEQSGMDTYQSFDFETHIMSPNISGDNVKIFQINPDGTIIFVPWWLSDSIEVNL